MWQVFCTLLLFSLKIIYIPIKNFINICKGYLLFHFWLSYIILNHLSFASLIGKLWFSTNANDFVSNTSVYKYLSSSPIRIDYQPSLKKWVLLTGSPNLDLFICSVNEIKVEPHYFRRNRGESQQYICSKIAQLLKHLGPCLEALHKSIDCSK